MQERPPALPTIEDLRDVEAKRAHAKEVWGLIVKTYQGHGNSEDGNLYGAELENLIVTPGPWKLAFKDRALIAGVIYRAFKGNKARLLLHNDTREAKDAVKRTLLQDFSSGGYWAEASGNLERVLTAANVQRIPNTDAGRLLEKEIAKLDPDGFHYEREVHPGTIKREMLFGSPIEER